MDKIKNKFEVILGFATLIISLSAFKDELSKVTLELGYTSITLADYFLWVVYGLSICMYFYVTENFARDTKFGKWKLFNYTLNFAYFLFVFILITPLLVVTNILIFKAYVAVAKNHKEIENTLEIVNKVVGAISVILAIISSILTSSRLLRERKKKAQEEIEEQEIKELDNATKLFADGYYSHSVLETFKVLETHLYKKITAKDVRVPRHKINDIIQIALKEKIINQDDLSAINDLKGMRNAAAHSDAQHTRQQAEFSLNFVRQLLRRKNDEQETK